MKEKKKMRKKKEEKLYFLLINHFFFSFVSITTIGYGDITPTPNDAIQTAIIIIYLAIGMVSNNCNQ